MMHFFMSDLLIVKLDIFLDTGLRIDFLSAAAAETLTRRYARSRRFLHEQLITYYQPLLVTRPFFDLYLPLHLPRWHVR